MSTGPELIRTDAPAERNWLPMAIAAAVVAVVVIAGILIMEHGKKGPQVTPINAPLDAYAATLQVSNLKMSESGNLAGGKVTYVDGVLTNSGAKMVTGARIQVLFRNFAHEVVQNETQSLKLIRITDPYIDVEPASADPIKPGTQKGFRLSFDGVSPDWDGAFPEIRLISIETK